MYRNCNTHRVQQVTTPQVPLLNIKYLYPAPSLVPWERYLEQTSHFQYLPRMITGDYRLWMSFVKFAEPQTNTSRFKTLSLISRDDICEVGSAYQRRGPSLVSSQLVPYSRPKLCQPTGFCCHKAPEPKHTSRLTTSANTAKRRGGESKQNYHEINSNVISELGCVCLSRMCCSFSVLICLVVTSAQNNSAARGGSRPTNLGETYWIQNLCDQSLTWLKRETLNQVMSTTQICRSYEEAFFNMCTRS